MVATISAPFLVVKARWRDNLTLICYSINNPTPGMMRRKRISNPSHHYYSEIEMK